MRAACSIHPCLPTVTADRYKVYWEVARSAPVSLWQAHLIRRSSPDPVISGLKYELWISPSLGNRKHTSQYLTFRFAGTVYQDSPILVVIAHTTPQTKATVPTMTWVVTREFLVNKWIAKTYAEAGTGSIVTSGEPGRRLVVPVAIDGEIPIELPPELDVVRSVQIELHSSRLRKSG